MKPGTIVIEAAKRSGSRSRTTATTRASPSRRTAGCASSRCRTRPAGSSCRGARCRVAGGLASRRTSPQVKEPAARGPGVPAPQPPGRLPDLRPGRRVQAAGLLHELRPQAVAARRCRRSTRGSASTSGRRVVLDQERCILCTRCVRFMRRGREDRSSACAERGNESFIARSRASRSTGSTPATWSTSARSARSPRRTSASAARVWFMSSARASAPAARAAATRPRLPERRAYRYRPRENEAVNKELDVRRGPRPTST